MNAAHSLAAALLLLQGAALALLARHLRGRGRAARPIWEICAAFVLMGALLYAGWALIALDIERHAALMWLLVSASAMAVGVWSARRMGRVPTLELVLACVLVVELCALLVMGLRGGEGGLAASPAVRALLALPAVLLLCSFFGASLGFLLWGGAEAELHVGYEARVGRRLLLSKSSTLLSTVTTISVMGVALGVWLIIVSLAILTGFEQDLRRKLIGANAHLVLQQGFGRPFVPDADDLARVRAAPGVVAATPFLEGEVAAASNTNYTGGLLVGVDPLLSPEVLTVLGTLASGTLDALRAEADAAAGAQTGDDTEFPAPAALPNIVLGREMAKALHVDVGDRVRVISPLLETITPMGVAPRSQGFRVAGIFSSEMFPIDSRYAYVTLQAARRFFELGAGAVSGFQVRVGEPDLADEVGRQIAARLGPAYQARDWMERNQTLFSALKLEKVVTFIVLVFIILVASFSIVSTLTISVMEKRKEIAILLTMGARRASIMKVFLVQGMLVGLFGTALGTVAAIVTAVSLRRFGFGIPRDVYYIDSLPIDLEAMDVAAVVVAALLIVWNFAVFPALRASELDPVEGLRDG